VICSFRLSKGISRRALLRRVARCAIALQEKYSSYAIELAHGEKLILRMHFGLACGEMRRVIIGGVGGRWDSLIVGSPYQKLLSIMEDSSPGDIIVQKDVYDCLRNEIESFQFEATDNRNYRLTQSEKIASGSSSPIIDVVQMKNVQKVETRTKKFNGVEYGALY